MPDNLYSSPSPSPSPSSFNADSGCNPPVESCNQREKLKILIKRWNDVDQITDKFAGVSKNAEAGVDKVRQVGNNVAIYIEQYQAAISNMHNASCKTALDLLPLSKRSNGAQNEISDKEVYKQKLKNFKLQLTEIDKFLDNPELTEDQLGPFKEAIPQIEKNISELTDLIPYLIPDKSNKEDVTIGQPPLIRSGAPSAPILLSRSHTKVLQSSSTRVNDVEQLLLTQRSPVAPFSRQ